MPARHPHRMHRLLGADVTADVEVVDWMTFCLELLRRLDRIADELQRMADAQQPNEESSK
jgi:hypothetical protein